MLNKKEAQKLLSGKNPTSATLLVALLSKHFGSFEWFGWEPQVLRVEVQEDFDTEMATSVIDQIYGMITALTTDRFYTDPLSFTHICNALSGGPTSFADFEPPTIDEMAWALFEVALNDTDDDTEDEFKFSPEVLAYIQLELKNAGMKPFGPFELVPDFDTIFHQDPLVSATNTDSYVDRRDALMEDMQEKFADLNRDLRAVGLPSLDQSEAEVLA